MTTPEETQELPEEQPVEEVNYQVKATELESQVAKLENDLRSKDGQRRRDTDRDTELAGFKDELAAIRKVFSAYMDNMQQGGDPDVLQSQLSQINQDAAQSQQQRDVNTRYEREQTRLLSTVQDAEGNLLISEDDATKIQTQWQAAWQTAQEGNFDAVYDLQIEAQRMVNQAERRQADSDKKVLREEAKTASKKALEKAGINDLDTGAAIAGGSEELHGAALIERGLRKGSSRILT